MKEAARPQGISVYRTTLSICPCQARRSPSHAIGNRFRNMALPLVIPHNMPSKNIETGSTHAHDRSHLATACNPPDLAAAIAIPVRHTATTPAVICVAACGKTRVAVSAATCVANPVATPSAAPFVKMSDGSTGSNAVEPMPNTMPPNARCLIMCVTFTTNPLLK